jgi:NAD(P)-dependent dehydrogenase (short-subunit alcohol dehydrogenase family)
MNKKAALVVGATGGLGHAACLALARDWDGVAIGYRSSEAKAKAIASQLPDSCEGLPLRCDLADTTSITSAVETARDHFGSIGTVVFPPRFPSSAHKVAAISSLLFRSLTTLSHQVMRFQLYPRRAWRR